LEVDEGTISRNTSGFETDPSGVDPLETAETAVDFSESTRIRFREIVHCDGNRTVIVRVRYVSVTNETPGPGFTVRRRLIITLHSQGIGRCKTILIDPSLDMAPTDQGSQTQPGDTNTGTVSVTSTDGTSTSSSNNAIVLSIGLLSLILSLFI
jgi:hypothetical protein